MRALAVRTAVTGAAAIAALGALVGAALGVSFSDGIGWVCLAGTIVWLGIGLVVCAEWLVRGRAPVALRAAAATGFAALVIAAAWVEVNYTAFDGCNWTWGRQHLITVPVSLVTEEPLWALSTNAEDLPCGSPDGRAYSPTRHGVLY